MISEEIGTEEEEDLNIGRDRLRRDRRPVPRRPVLLRP